MHMTTRHSVKAYSLPGMVQIAKKGGNNPNIAVEFVRMVDKEEFGIKKRSDDISETDVHDHKFIFGEPIYVKALDLDAIPLAEIIRLCDYPNTEKWRDYEVKWNPRNTGYDEATLKIKVRRCDFTWRNYFFSNLFGWTPRTIVSVIRKTSDGHLEFVPGFPQMFENTLYFRVPSFRISITNDGKDLRVLVTDATGLLMLCATPLLELAKSLEDKTLSAGSHGGISYYWTKNPGLEATEAKENAPKDGTMQVTIRKVERHKPSLLMDLHKDKDQETSKQIETEIGIDFSSSNRSLLAPEGLHRDMGGDELNIYEGALKVICELMSLYGPVRMWALCAKGEVGLTGYNQQQPKVMEIPSTTRNRGPTWNEYFRTMYQAEKKSVQFSGPTNIAPFLKEVTQRDKSPGVTDRMVTTLRVVFVLTDGMIADIQESGQTIRSTKTPIPTVYIFVQVDKGGASAQALQKLEEELKGADDEQPIVDCIHFKEEYIHYPEGFRKLFSRSIVRLYAHAKERRRPDIKVAENISQISCH